MSTKVPPHNISKKKKVAATQKEVVLELRRRFLIEHLSHDDDGPNYDIGVKYSMGGIPDFTIGTGMDWDLGFIRL